MALAAPVDTRSRISLISFCTVQLRTLCAAHSLATLCLCMTSGPDPGELPGFWGSMVFRHAPIPRKGSGNQQQQQAKQLDVTNIITREIAPSHEIISPPNSSFSEIVKRPLIPRLPPTFTLRSLYLLKKMSRICGVIGITKYRGCYLLGSNFQGNLIYRDLPPASHYGIIESFA